MTIAAVARIAILINIPVIIILFDGTIIGGDDDIATLASVEYSPVATDQDKNNNSSVSSIKAWKMNTIAVDMGRQGRPYQL